MVAPDPSVDLAFDGSQAGLASPSGKWTPVVAKSHEPARRGVWYTKEDYTSRGRDPKYVRNVC